MLKVKKSLSFHFNGINVIQSGDHVLSQAAHGNSTCPLQNAWPNKSPWDAMPAYISQAIKRECQNNELSALAN